MTLARAHRQRIPSYSLYGELGSGRSENDSIHIEDIPSRSRRYRWKIATHLHQDRCQCVYLVSGAVVADLEDVQQTLEGPVVICVPAGTAHAFTFRAGSQGYVLTVELPRVLSDAGLTRQASFANLFAGPHVIDLTADAALAARTRQLFDSLFREFRQPDSYRSPVASWLACCALWILSAAHPDAASPLSMPHRGYGRHDVSRLWKFRQLIELHFLNHWSVARYARTLALSASSLNRLCQGVAKCTPFDLVQQRLALEARRQLMYVPESIASIASKLGFKDPAYFSRFFRKHVGVSPAGFRKRQEAGR